MRALAERVVALTNSRSRLVHRPLPEDDPLQRCPDIALAKRLLDWRPATSLDDGLARTVAYFDRLLSGRGDRARQPEPTRALPPSR